MVPLPHRPNIFQPKAGVDRSRPGFSYRAAGALEEDARLTALFLWTIQVTNDELQDSGEEEDEEEESAEEEEVPPGGEVSTRELPVPATVRLDGEP